MNLWAKLCPCVSIRRGSQHVSERGDSLTEFSAPGLTSDQINQFLAPPRYEGYRQLKAAGIPCMIWREDLLAAYGVPTSVSDLFLLVHEPEEAAEALQRARWTHVQPNPRFTSNIEYSEPDQFVLDLSVPELSFEAMRLAPRSVAERPRTHPAPGEPAPGVDHLEEDSVVLLQASRWAAHPLSDTAGSGIPTLEALLNCLMMTYLDCDRLNFREHVCVDIEYIYEYLGDIVKSPGYEQYLRPEVRQLHFDIINHEIPQPCLLSNHLVQQHYSRVRMQYLSENNAPT